MLSTLHIPFGATSTAAELVAGGDLSGKRAIAGPGGSSGIGVDGGPRSGGPRRADAALPDLSSRNEYGRWLRVRRGDVAPRTVVDAWEGKTKAQICEQMKDPARNGGCRTGEEVIST